MKKGKVICTAAIGSLLILGTFLFIKNVGVEEIPKTRMESQINDYPQLVVAYPSSAAGSKDQEMVEELVNRMVRKKLGLEIKFVVISSSYEKLVNRMLSGKEQLDIIFTSNMYTELVLNKELYELSDLIKQYGQGIIKELGQEIVDTCLVKGKLYGIPNNRDFAVGWNAYMLRKDILDKYNIKPDSIETISDLEAVFTLVKENEENMQVVDVQGSTMFLNCYFADGVNGSPIGVLMDSAQSEKFVNVFETKEYMNALKRVRKWYLAGFMGKDGLERTETVYKKIQNNKLFSYAYRGKPGVEQQETMSCGTEMVCVQLGENIVSHNSPAAMPWAITNNTASAQKAMELLNLLYTDKDILNLLCYGIENVHYVKTEDGHITYPEKNNINIFIGNAWRMPNQFLTYVWEGSSLNLWEEMRLFNKNAIQGKDFGFNFDIEPVSTKYILLEDIYRRYKSILENGLVDPKEGLEEMNKEMKANFIDEVIEEKQRQFDEWRVNKSWK